MALRAVAPPLPSPTEPLFWGGYFLAGDQTMGLTVGSPVRFANTIGNLVVGPTYRVVLPAGRTFRLTAALRPEFSGSNGTCSIRWYNETAGTAVPGRNGFDFPVTYTGHTTPQPTTYCAFTTDVETTVYLSIVSLASLTRIYAAQSYGEIMEIR